MDEIVISNKKEKINIVEIIIDNKDYIYPACFYIAGIILGTFFFEFINNSAFSKVMDDVFKLNQGSFIDIFLNRFCIYFSLFSITVFLGMCLVGFPIINALPLICGLEIALKLSYYYVNFSAKGIGYCVLMIIPECAAFLTVLIYTIKLSSQLSKNIYAFTTKKTDIEEEFTLSPYLKNFFVYALCVTGISAINAGIIYLLANIISI